MPQKILLLCKRLFIILLFGIFILWYKHIANLYINPENAIHQYGKDANRNVIDFVKFEEDNKMHYIFCTEQSLNSMRLQQNAFGLWHLSSTSGSSLLIKQQMHPTFAYDVLYLSETAIIYGCPLLDNVKEACLIIDTGKETIKMSYLFEDTSKLFWFDLGDYYGLYKKIELELVSQEGILVSNDILFQRMVDEKGR